MFFQLRKLIVFVFIGCVTFVHAQEKESFVPFINEQHNWVDAVFDSLTPEERIGQLFMVRAHSNLGKAYIDSVAQVIEKEQLGGIVVFQGSPEGHVNMINRYQKLTKVPLLTSIDGEWGLGMRLPKASVSYPYQMTLGAIQNDDLLYLMGEEIAKDLKRIGVHFNFAPVVDINNNPKNPVIGFRSFGDDKKKVVRKAEAYMNGMMNEQVISSLKHFPGHGDTDVDSHKDLPKLNFSRERLDTLELYPFKELIKRDAPAIMTGHMDIPVLDNTPHIASSISKKIINDLLVEELGFKGLVVTDAMTMQGVRKYFPGTEADLKAIEAGNDILELSKNSGRAIQSIKKAIASGRLSQKDINQRVKKVLAAKYWLGLDNYQPTKIENLYADLHRQKALNLVDSLAEKAVTVVKSKQGIEGFSTDKNTALVRVGTDGNQDFEKYLINGISTIDTYGISGGENKSTLRRLLKKIKKHDQIILAIHDNKDRPRVALNLPKVIVRFIEKLSKENTISTLFTSPYILDELPVGQSSSIVLGYQNDGFMQKAAAKAILKEIPTSGKLPVTVNEAYKNGDGY